MTSSKQGRTTTIQDTAGKCLTEEQDILKRSIEYFSELYTHTTTGDPKVLDVPPSTNHDSYAILRLSHWYDSTPKNPVTITLRTGHNRMNVHKIMYSKLKIGQTDRCPCDTAPMTSQHLLQDCPLHDIIRQETWSYVTSLRDKFFRTDRLCREQQFPLKWWASPIRKRRSSH